MNGVKYVLLIIMLLCSCGTPRNIESNRQEDFDVSKVAMHKLKFDAASEFDFGSTKIQEIVFKRIEYFPPDTSGQSKIKSEEQMTITQKHDVLSSKNDTLEISSDSTIVEDTHTTNVVEVIEETAKDPYRWRYILEIIIVITIIATIIYIKVRGSKLVSSISSFIKHWLKV